MTQRWLTCLFLALVSAMIPAWPQDTAVLTGLVIDSSGAVVVNARVAVVNVENNFETLTATNSEGLYRIPFLRPGTYRVKMAAPGFKSFVRENVELRVGATLPVDATLEL